MGSLGAAPMDGRSDVFSIVALVWLHARFGCSVVAATRNLSFVLSRVLRNGILFFFAFP